MKLINEELLNVKACDIYSYYCVLKGHYKEVLQKIDLCKF